MAIPTKITLVTKDCPKCGAIGGVKVYPKDIQRWRSGTFIQVAFPYLKPEDRERLLTGYCSRCWNDLFPDDEDN